MLTRYVGWLQWGVDEKSKGFFDCISVQATQSWSGMKRSTERSHATTFRSLVMKKFLSTFAALALVLSASYTFAQEEAAPAAEPAAPAAAAEAVAPCDAVAPCEPVAACEPVCETAPAPCAPVCEAAPAPCAPVCCKKACCKKVCCCKPCCCQPVRKIAKRAFGVVSKVRCIRIRCCKPCCAPACAPCAPVAPCAPAAAC